MSRGALALRVGSEAEAAVGLIFESAAPGATLTGENQRGSRYNFFIGDDPRQWRSGVAAFASVRYRGLYEEVDLVVREEAGKLEYDLILAPHADLEKVIVRAEGASSIDVAADGALVLETAAGPLRQTPPRTWEVLANGTKRALECRFRKIDEQRYGFVAPERDRTLAMVVDPGLEWSTFLGGVGHETVTGLAMTYDCSGDIVLSGQTLSPDFPHSGGNFTAVGGTPYVARMNAAGTALVYCTFFGGSFNHSVLCKISAKMR